MQNHPKSKLARFYVTIISYKLLMQSKNNVNGKVSEISVAYLIHLNKFY